MTTGAERRNVSNLLLRRLSDSDFALLKQGLFPIELPVRFQIERAKGVVKYIYFIEQGIVSIVAGSPFSNEIEVGIVGREGMTGFSVLMGEERAAYRSFVQVAGTALRLPVDQLTQAISESRILHTSLLRFGFALYKQTASTAAANGLSTVEARLARWLLMVSDRVESHDVRLTHDFLATMLGVRRAGVTEVLGIFQSARLIRNERGKICILDRKGLEKRADGAYQLL